MKKLIISIAAMLFATSANATLHLSIDETTDAAAGVTTSGSPIVQLSTTTTNFSVAAGTGIDLDIPAIFDLAVQANSSGAGTLVVMLSETGLSGIDYAVMDSIATLKDLSGAGTGTGTFTVDMYVDKDNGIFGMDNLIATGSGTDFEVGGSFAGYLDGDFSLTLVATIVSEGTGYFVSSDTLVVPEPSILALLSAGLIGLGVAARRRA